MAVVTKSIATDFSGTFIMHVFYREIEAAIADPLNALNDRTLNWIRTDADVVSTDFDAVLDAGEVTAFDTIVSNHPSIVVIQGEQKKTFTAVIPPTVDDDADDNVDVGDIWVDTASSKSYINTDTTVGAAVWKLLAPEAGAATIHTVNPTNLDDTGLGYNVGDTWVNTVTGNVFVLVDGTNDAAVWRPITDNVMGGLIVKGDSLGVTTTNNTNFIQKLSIATPATIEAGDYMLVYSYQWNIDSTSRNFEARIQQNNTTDLFVHVEEATNAGGDWQQTGSDQRMPVAGHTVVTLTAAVHTFDLDFKAPAANTPVSMWNARMYLQRISGDPAT